MDSIISESCYKGIILQRNYRKMTISWSFFYDSIVKFPFQKFRSNNMTVLNPNPCYNKVFVFVWFVV